MDLTPSLFTLTLYSVTLTHIKAQHVELLHVCAESYGTVLKKYDVIKHDGSILTCLFACQHFPKCRSVVVNHVTNMCVLNKRRNVWLNCSEPDAVYASMPTSTMRLPCTSNKICTDAQTECRHKICQCLPGLSYDESNGCVEDCPNDYGDTFQEVRDHVIQGFTDEVMYNSTADECRQACVDVTSFTCRHATFNKITAECNLSMDTYWTAELASPGSYMLDTYFDIYFRDCQGDL